MPPTQDNEFLDHVLDLLQAFGPVKGRKMFGGFGIFLDGVMFALIADDMLYFKTDDETAAEFEALDLLPFTYNRKGRDVTMSYYQAPEAALEDDEEMERWAALAFGVANKG